MTIACPAGSCADQLAGLASSAASSALTSVVTTPSCGALPHDSSNDLEMSHHRIENVTFADDAPQARALERAGDLHAGQSVALVRDLDVDAEVDR